MATKLQRLRDNIAALQHALTSDKCDNEILSKYTGFGGLGFVLNPLDTGAWAASDLDCFVDTMKLQNLLRDNSKDEREFKAWMQSLKASTLTAFYTPTPFIWKIMEAIFGAYVPRYTLDPAAGSHGYFMKAAGFYSLENKKIPKLVAYEKDLLSGLILERFKGENQEVRVKGFETISEDELCHYDLVATNVPFGDIKVFDPAYSNSDNQVRRNAARMIHRYYVLKGLDCLRNGGLLAYIITSNYLNRDTEQLAEALKSARLIGAYRLANNLFKDSGTEVGTDLLVLQKQEGRGELTLDETMLLSTYTDNDCPTNLYFTMKPDHVIATETRRDTDAYGKPGFTYLHKDGVTGIAQAVREVLARDLTANFTSILSEQRKAKSEKPAEKKPRLTKKQARLVDMQKCYAELYSYEQNEQKENAELRNKLNELYDEFVKEYGFLNDALNKNSVKNLKADELLGLEVKTDGHWQKADIMLRPIAFAAADENKTYTAKEALAASLNEYGKPNIGYMVGLTGMDEEQLLDELQGEVFYNPLINEYEIKAKFVSGNVIEKIESLTPGSSPKGEGSEDPRVAASLAALKAAIPTPIPFEQLDFNLGERWVDADVYSRFASEFFSMPVDPRCSWRGGKTEVEVKYEAAIDQYAVSCHNSNEKVWTEYSVASEASKRLDGMDLLTHALQDTTPTLMKYQRDSNGHIMYDDDYNKIKVEDPEKTQLAATKIEEIRRGYEEWLQRQPKAFRDELADAYNRRFNCFVKPKYDGSHQTFPGLNMKGLREKYGVEHLYDSQKDCIWMLLLNGGGICDHEVGSGKTLIMCIAAHEMKRLGMCHKPMIIGLKANVSAIAETYQTAYPDAKILFATASDYSAANRVEFFNKMKNNDYDCIIMSHEQFGRIPQSDAVQRDLLQDEIQQLDDALQLLESESYGISSRMRKGLEQRKRNKEAALEKLMDSINNRKDDVVDFEMMGIDHIFVDESHQFKNLGFSTRHDRVAGIGNTEGSKRAFNMLMAIRTIQNRTGRDLGATFLSGTTVTNSLTELYSLFRYLRPKALAKQRITCFDAWAAIFTKKSKEFEFSITNAIVMKERFRYFIKVPELAMFYNEITDFRTAEDVGIERPEKHAMLLNIKPTPDQEEFINVLMKFAKDGDFSLIGIHNPTDKQVKAKMLYATDLARKMSLDMRMIDPAYGDHPNNKASRCAKLVKQYYDKYDSQKGTQLIFSDLSTYQGKDKGWDVYSEIKRKLVTEYGIPASEIRFIQECKSDRAKQQMIAEVNKGNIRVLFGSTTMLGTGVNAQQRVVAVHHLDTPWRPSDLEQRDGRAVRKGNEIAKLYADNKVDIIIYAVERSLDSYKFNLLHCKQVFINQLKRGQLSIRTLDEGAMDENTGMNFSEYMAILSGNTDLLERAKLERKIAGLEAERKSFYRDQTEQTEKRTQLQNDNERLSRDIKDAREDWSRFNKARRLTEDGLVVNDAVVDDWTVPADVVPGTTDYAKALGAELLRIDCEARTEGNCQKVGSIYGFPILVRTEKVRGLLDKEYEYHNYFFVEGGRIKWQTNKAQLNHVSARLASEYPLQVLQGIPTVIAAWEEEVEANKVSIEQLDAILTRQWGKDEQLSTLRSELKALDRKIEKELHAADKQEAHQPLAQAA